MGSVCVFVRVCSCLSGLIGVKCVGMYVCVRSSEVVRKSRTKKEGCTNNSN